MIERVFVATAILVASSSWAMAYLDPGTGSLALQMLLAAALTAAASIRIFWTRVKDVFRRMFRSKVEPGAGIDA